MTWVIERPTIGHGIAGWFDCEMMPGIGFSNAPTSDEQHVYSQTFFAWPSAVSLATGDTVQVRLRADLIGDRYIWTWKTDVTDASTGAVKASFRQSSMIADFLGAELHKRAHTFVADLGEESKIDRSILKLMARKMPLGDIATEILRTFPSAFKDWNAALGQVGLLSDRYSR
jgi:protein arginine N-methyltransferase 1